MTELQAVKTELQQIRTLLQVVAHATNRHIDRHEFAERLGISTSTLDRRIKAGTVPAPVNGKWSLVAVIEWEQSQTKFMQRVDEREGLGTQWIPK